MSKNYDISIEAATEKATKQYNQILNDGLHTEKHYFYDVVDVKNNDHVGALWFNHQEKDRQVFIYEIWIVPEERGKGYGTKTLEELHHKAKDLGAEIGLHVFGQNTGAIALYRRLGYEENSIVMTRKL
ncbi:GNAT family N-acetyltransferase [Pseudalkalibacillus salsuginis]|uniref:GNAT family N-acetyltransferase n=1 Tax=Pseudalkalibacillus salsuginis TaxID=2910972 RepID=UPI001F47D38C|nr:GNAT family N-acetyltransferase [Pseudalkalibacillus salsuginis]MCF6411175.1 GNAT family N-acetyltransferase [Pseudalkalibacillus salsuginis]